MFVFAICQVGAEDALKREIARVRPEFRPAYSRPGFLTFKGPEGPPDPGVRLDLVLGRVRGVSLGRAAGDTVEARAHSAMDLLSPVLGGTPARLHVFDRDRFLPGDEPLHWHPGDAAPTARAALVHAGGKRFARETLAQPGDLVVDIVLVEPGEWWVGAHRHHDRLPPWPGGRAPLILPPEAPSRAWLKAEEMLLWSRAPLRPGDRAVEVGSAPGGTSWALLTRGLEVTGIDPAAMDPRILGHVNFRHVRKPIGVVARRDLPQRFEWLWLDVNAGPDEALPPAIRLATWAGDALLGAILTIKRNERAVTDRIPEVLEACRSVGLLEPRAAQLGFHRREVGIYGLTAAGRRRALACEPRG